MAEEKLEERIETPQTKKPKIFEGIRIIDVSHFLSGPWATEFFAQDGAEVIKVEPPGFGDSLRIPVLFVKQFFPLFSIINNNKKSITLNLKEPQAQEIFRKLVKVSDAVVSNLKVGVMKEWKLDYEHLKKVKQDLIYVSISGFGMSGLEKFTSKPAFDLIAQAASGTLDVMQIKEAPAIPMADYSAAHIAAISLASALFYRERTGEGQLVDISMQDVMYALNMPAHAREFITQASNMINFSRPLPIYNQYPTKDKRKIAVVVLTEPQWERFCDNVLKKPELKEDERFNNPLKRFNNLEKLDEIVKEYALNKTWEEAIFELEAQKIPCSKVLKMDEIRDHPQLKARGTLNTLFNFSKYKVEKATMPNPIIRYSKTPGELTHPAPKLRKHNKEILCDLLGYSKEELKKFKQEHVI